MKTVYFKAIVQKAPDGKAVLIAVIDDEVLGKDLPEIFEVQAFKMPSTIYTGTYPQLKINTDTVKERADLKGLGIAGILTSEGWYSETRIEQDHLGISLE